MATTTANFSWLFGLVETLHSTKLFYLFTKFIEPPSYSIKP